MEMNIFDLSAFLNLGPEAAEQSEELQKQCKEMAECMHKTGILIIRDPRVSVEDNEKFLSNMEAYFAQPDEDKLKDSRPELHYQVGSTPSYVEVPRCSKDPECMAKIDSMPEEHKAHKPVGPDAKERFFWRMGEPPKETEFPALNAPPVVPANFPDWATTMNSWGHKMLDAIYATSEMLAMGLDLPRRTFLDLMQHAPHLLAPTGTDLLKHRQLDTIYAGFHYDLSFLTIHGRSRVPGLFVWLRSGEKQLVRVPEGCLLIQAGKQMEILTGGYVEAGYHEVVCCEETLAAIRRLQEERRKKEKTEGTAEAELPLWRVSTTLFSHIASDQVLRPLGKFGEDEAVREKYPPIKTGDQVQRELRAINLAAASSSM
ncbi:2OG-Fe(II) oxygenase family oxidoreductase [Balamuthia mandrillaris]